MWLLPIIPPVSPVTSPAPPLIFLQRLCPFLLFSIHLNTPPLAPLPWNPYLTISTTPHLPGSYPLISAILPPHSSGLSNSSPGSITITADDVVR